MTAHKYAAWMLQYAHDAAETDKPWLRWECLPVGDFGGGDWCQLSGHPTWEARYHYRRKAKTIRIGEFDVPEPLRVAPAEGTVYYTPRLFLENEPAQYDWRDDTADKQWLRNGLVHLTPEAAELHAKALLSFTRGDE